MADDYEIFFNEVPLSIQDVRGSTPAACLHPLRNCHISLVYTFASAKIYRQRYELRQFRVELFQLDARVPFRFGYRTLENKLFILFCLDGEVSFIPEEQRSISIVRKGYFYVSRNDAGTYSVYCRKSGTCLVLAVSISPAWAKRKAKCYPRLNEAMSLLLESDRKFGIMPQCEIGDDVLVWLRFLERFAGSVKKNFAILLKDLIVGALGYYENMLEERCNDPIYKVKEYIDQNYSDPDLTVHRLAERFYFQEKTMRKKFVMEFHVTPVKYLTAVRLKEASRLIDEMELPISTVWAKVGYNDRETFRQAYGK